MKKIEVLLGDSHKNSMNFTAQLIVNRAEHGGDYFFIFLDDSLYITMQRIILGVEFEHIVGKEAQSFLPETGSYPGCYSLT